MGETSSSSVMGLPAPSLRPFIGSYIGYRLLGFPPGLHRGLPSRHLTFIVSLGDPIDVVAQTDPRQAPDSYSFVIGGLQLSTAMISHNGNQEGVAIELNPLGCRTLLGMPARALWNTSVEGEDVLGATARELSERLHQAPDWGSRFAIVDEVLTGLIDARTAVAPEVNEAWRLVVASGGTIPVTELASTIGWSRRHLAHRFGQELGMSPKAVARVVRFERARRMLQGQRHGTIADVAATCGFYDQSHLNRDFVELAGCPPSEWLTEELPSIQDGDRLDPAQSSV